METRILSVAIAIWLAALVVLVVMRILNGSISTDGLLSVRAGGDASPERVQLLIVSLIGVAVYAADVLSKSSTGTLPDVPATLLTVMAGSQLIYLGGKLMRGIKQGDDKWSEMSQ